MKTATGVEFADSHLVTLLSIENGLGVYANIGIPKSIVRDAGRLLDAIRGGDAVAANAIGKRYYSELPKGECTGGPKYIKPGSAVKKAIARAALNFYRSSGY